MVIISEKIEIINKNKVMITGITKENKEEWLVWINEQLNTVDNADYTQTGVNRVFLTEEDDIDIAKFIIKTLKATIELL